MQLSGKSNSTSFNQEVYRQHQVSENKKRPQNQFNLTGDECKAKYRAEANWVKASLCDQGFQISG